MPDATCAFGGAAIRFLLRESYLLRMASPVESRQAGCETDSERPFDTEGRYGRLHPPPQPMKKLEFPSIEFFPARFCAPDKTA